MGATLFAILPEGPALKNKLFPLSRAEVGRENKSLHFVR